jgi:hypothetical protein
MAGVGASMGAHGEPAGVGKEGERGGGEGARHGGGMGRGRAARTVGSLAVLLCCFVFATFCSCVKKKVAGRRRRKRREGRREKKRKKEFFYKHGNF